MNRILVTVLIILLFAAVGAKAQTLVGARAGLNFSNINGIGSTRSNFDWRQSYHGGIFLYSNIGDRIFFQPELMIGSRGYYYRKKFSEDRAISGDTIELHQETKLKYLDIPLLLKLQIGKVFFEAGPQFGFLTSSQSYDTFLLHQSADTIKLKSAYNSHQKMELIDIGFVAGLGYQMNSGLSVNFRYNQGFREVMKGTNWQKNILLQTSLAYTFGYKSFIDSSTKDRSTDKYEEYFSLSKAREKQQGYKVISKFNIQRINVSKVGDSDRSEIQYVFNSVGSHTPTSVLLVGSSGFEEQTTLFTGFRDIQIPFKGTLRFTTKSSIGSGSVESNIELEISKPGIWRVTILTQ